MTEKALRNTFVLGTLFFLAVLGVMTWDSLSQVTTARSAALTPEVVAGKRVWQRKNCNDCHTILGIGGYYAPDLTKEASRRDAAWLERWIADPQAVHAGATMPNPRLAAVDASNLVAFIRWVNTINTNDWPPAPRLRMGGGAPDGALLFEQKGCSVCHRLGDQGQGEPDLSHIGGTPYDALPNTPEFLAKWLADPAAQKPGTLMPRVPLTAAERDALVQYLTSLQ